MSGAETLVDQKLENSKINACDVVLIPEIDNAQMPCLTTNQPKESTNLKRVKVTSKKDQDFPVISIDTQDTLFKNLTNQLQGNGISLSSLFKVQGTSGPPDKQDKSSFGRKEQNSHSGTILQLFCNSVAYIKLANPRKKTSVAIKRKIIANPAHTQKKTQRFCKHFRKISDKSQKS